MLPLVGGGIAVLLLLVGGLVWGLGLLGGGSDPVPPAEGDATVATTTDTGPATSATESVPQPTPEQDMATSDAPPAEAAITPTTEINEPTVANTSSTSPESSEVNFIQVTENDVAVIVARPDRILNNNLVKRMLAENEAADQEFSYEVMASEFAETFSVKPDQLDYAVITISPVDLLGIAMSLTGNSRSGNSLPGTLLLHSRVPFNEDQFATKLESDSQEPVPLEEIPEEELKKLETQEDFTLPTRSTLTRKPIGERTLYVPENGPSVAFLDP